MESKIVIDLVNIGSEQTKGTYKTTEKLVWFLNYCKTNPEANIRYHASVMVFHIHSDTSYLYENQSKISVIRNC